MTRKQILWIGADNLVRFDGAKNSSSGAYLNAATVTMTLKDSGGSPVAGATGVNLYYVSGSNGRYEGTLESTLALVDGAEYTLEITFAEAGLEDFRTIPCIAKRRALK